MGTCDTRGHGPSAQWLSLPFYTPEGARGLSWRIPAPTGSSQMGPLRGLRTSAEYSPQPNYPTAPHPVDLLQLIRQFLPIVRTWWSAPPRWAPSALFCIHSQDDGDEFCRHHELFVSSLYKVDVSCRSSSQPVHSPKSQKARKCNNTTTRDSFGTHPSPFRLELVLVQLRARSRLPICFFVICTSPSTGPKKQPTQLQQLRISCKVVSTCPRDPLKLSSPDVKHFFK